MFTPAIKDLGVFFLEGLHVYLINFKLDDETFSKNRR